MQQPAWIPVWVFYLMVINMTCLVFWHEPTAKIIFVTYFASFILMLSLYTRFGFEKILGFGHILWIPLLIYIVIQIPTAAVLFKGYLAVLSLSLAICLTLDVIDVWKYFTHRKTT
jgi:hypothetical protein